MFKLVVLSVLLAVVAAKPSGHIVTDSYAHAPIVGKTITYSSGLDYDLVAPGVEHSVYNYHPEVAVAHSTIAKVGEIVEKVPTAVSHQSSTVVHSSAKVVTPIVAPVATKTVISPAHVSYSAPLHHHHDTYLSAAPVSYSSSLHHSVPVHKTISYETPYSYGSGYGHGDTIVSGW